MRSKQRLLYHIAHPEFYETIDRYRPDPRDYLDPVRSILPAGWRLTRFGPWCQCTPRDARLPNQGWKIHLSATHQDASSVLQAAAAVLGERGIPFKFAVDARLHHLINNKRWSRGASGKFVTVYPRSDQEFLELLPMLDAATAAFAGPYVLSDRRYRDSRVVYYRYGTIGAPLRADVTGQTIGCLTAPDGAEIVDVRLPFFRPPPWVTDPVNPETGEPPPSQIALKDGRYRVAEVLGFTNAGGIYLADDGDSGRRVVLKEARPHVAVDPAAGDAVELLRREYELLTDVVSLGVGPVPYDLFTDWEHTFLVEEHLSGVTLRMHATAAFPLYRPDPPPDTIVAFRETARDIFENLATALARLHSRGIAFGDLSPTNVLILDGSSSLRFIDFEAAFKVDGRPAVDLYTPGFAPTRRGAAEPPGIARDRYALGAVMFSYLFPVNGLFDLAPSRLDDWLSVLTSELQLPPEIPASIAALMASDPSSRPGAAEIAERLRECRPRPGVVVPAQPTRGDAACLPPCEHPSPRDEADALARRIATHIDAVADPSRTDRLWPADPLVFLTNPLSVAYGACGVAVALQRVTGTCPPYAREWIARQPLSCDAYPAGLYVGLSGVAWAMLEIGLVERAREALELASRHPRLWDSPDLFYGAAGWGMANLKFHLATGDDRYLSRARDAAVRILAARTDEGGECCWRSIDQVYFGLGHGASGIALFLLYLALATRDQQWLEWGRRALDFDVNRAVPARWGGLAWPYHTAQPSPILPYWKYGSAGVGTVLLRYQQVAGNDRWRASLEGAADFVEGKYSVGSGFCLGLAGIGNFLLDGYQFTGDVRYRRRAEHTFAGLRLFAVETRDGVAFPGDTLARLSCDYATGSAGPALFCSRLARGGGAAFMLDELCGVGDAWRGEA